MQVSILHPAAKQVGYFGWQQASTVDAWQIDFTLKLGFFQHTTIRYHCWTSLNRNGIDIFAE